MPMIEAQIFCTGAYGVEYQHSMILVEPEDFPKLESLCAENGWTIRAWQLKGENLGALINHIKKEFQESEIRREKERSKKRAIRLTKKVHT